MSEKEGRERKKAARLEWRKKFWLHVGPGVRLGVKPGVGPGAGPD